MIYRSVMTIGTAVFVMLFGVASHAGDGIKDIPGTVTVGKRGACPENSICDQAAIEQLMETLSMKSDSSPVGGGGGGTAKPSKQEQKKEKNKETKENCVELTQAEIASDMAGESFAVLRTMSCGEREIPDGWVPATAEEMSEYKAVVGKIPGSGMRCGGRTFALADPERDAKLPGECGN